MLQLKGIVHSRSDTSGLLRTPGDAVLIEREYPRLLLISCPCGCKEEFPINLDPRAGPAWKLFIGKHTGISLFPSVWREDGCESHYVIWRNKILLFGRYDDGLDISVQSSEHIQFVEAVYDLLSTKTFVSFSEIAETLNEVPWDVLLVCRYLVRKRLAREGRKKQRGYFKRVQ